MGVGANTNSISKLRDKGKLPIFVYARFLGERRSREHIGMSKVFTAKWL
jgi:hypothetical protein